MDCGAIFIVHAPKFCCVIIENVNDTDNKNVALPNLVIFIIIIFWYILLT